MLIIPERCHEHFIQVITEATHKGLVHKLIAKLQWLNTYGDPDGDGKGGRVSLGYDGAAMSFSLMWLRHAPGELWIPWMHGGLIFHPDYSGNTPTGDGEWAVHT